MVNPKDQIILPLAWGILADFEVPHEICRQLEFPEFAWFTILWNLSKFEFIQTTFIFIFSIWKIQKTCQDYILVLGFFFKGSLFKNMKIKVVWMNSSLKRFHEILNQANSKNFSCLSHAEPKNLPGSPKQGQDDLVLLLNFNLNAMFDWP